MVATRAMAAGFRGLARSRALGAVSRHSSAMSALPSIAQPQADLQRWQVSRAPWRRGRQAKRLELAELPGAEPQDLTPEAIQRLCKRRVPGWSAMPQETTVAVTMTFSTPAELSVVRLDEERRRALAAAGLRERDVAEIAELRCMDAHGVPLQVDDLDDLSDFSGDLSFPMTVEAVYKRDSLATKEITTGLSNKNFRVDARSTTGPKAVLFRAYGASKGDLYDSEMELQIVKLLSHYEVGPQVFAHGDTWRIEEWYVGSTPLENSDMRNPSVLVQMAAQLASMHKLSRRADFPKDIGSQPPLTSQRLGAWGDHAAKAAGQVGDALDVAAVLGERSWLRSLLVDELSAPGCGHDVVFSHWDAQENNVLRTNYGLRLIDFEYSGMEHQAFDIANYFVECSVDYLAEDYPFYRITPENYPTQQEQRLFCSIYLSEYQGRAVNVNDAAVDQLMATAEHFSLASNYLWTLWSIMRASQASSDGSFDYLAYARSRWEMYLRAKAQLLSR